MCLPPRRFAPPPPPMMVVRPPEPDFRPRSEIDSDEETRSLGIPEEELRNFFRPDDSDTDDEPAAPEPAAPEGGG